MNEVLCQLHDRKSVRAYEDRPVEPEVKRAILEAAIQAPHGGKHGPVYHSGHHRPSENGTANSAGK